MDDNQPIKNKMDKEKDEEDKGGQGKDGEEISEYKEDPGSYEEVDKQTKENLPQKEQSDKGIYLELARFFEKLSIVSDDLNKRARVAIKGCPPRNAQQHMMKVVHKSEHDHVVNKSNYPCRPMKTFIWNKWSYTGQYRSPPGPDKEKLREILKETGYRLKITAGQRRYGGPPPAPGNGHQLVVSRIPRQWFEDKLIPLFQEFGKIYEVRLMIDSQNGYNRSFCFVSYCKKEDTEKACCLLNKYEVRPGKTLKANRSISKTRLRVDNISRGKSAEELKGDFEKITPRVKDVIVNCTPEMQENNLRNKGYCFVEYENHKQTLSAKEKLKYGWSLLFGYNISVKWDHPQDEPDEEFMSKVKVVHVKNLSRNTPSEDLKEKFEEFGSVERTKVVKDFGFVNFEKREDALKAIEEMNGKVFGKYNIECCLSKSQRGKIGMKKERLK